MRTNAPLPSPRPAPAAKDAPAPAPAPRPASGPIAPHWPGLSPIRDLTGLAGERRAEAHRANVRVREADARAYARYLDEYVSAARRCGTAQELRAMRRPARPEAGCEPGSRLAEVTDIDRPYQRQLGAYLEATGAISDVQLRLDGRPVPLDVFFDGALTAKVHLGGRTVGGTVSARGGVVPEAGLAGVTVQPGRVEAGLDVGAAAVKAAFAQGRLDGVEVSVRAAPGVRAFAKRSAGAVEHGVAVGGRVGGQDGAALHVEARASAGVNLLTQEVVHRALSRKSWWDGGDE